MKKLLLFMCLIVFVMSGCQKKEHPYATTVEYSNLASSKSIDKVIGIMKQKKIPQDSIDVFANHVKQFNDTVKNENLVGDFKSTDNFAPIYDPYKFQDVWNIAHPDFMGYNCRITSYGLFKSFVEVDKTFEKKSDLLFLDKEAIASDNSAVQNSDELDKFERLYSSISTTDSKDGATQVKIIEEELTKRLKFSDNKDVRLISVFFHDTIEPTKSNLFIGHVGVAIKADKKIYFIEKIAFQEPYQVNIFDDMTQLSDFLMKRYDVEKEPTSARPMIFDNAKLIDGYRVNPDNK